MALNKPFPTIKPTSRSYNPGMYPSTSFESLDGTKTHLRFGNKRVNATLSLGFSNITDAEAALILESYQDVLHKSFKIYIHPLLVPLDRENGYTYTQYYTELLHRS